MLSRVRDKSVIGGICQKASLLWNTMECHERWYSRRTREFSVDSVENHQEVLCIWGANTDVGKTLVSSGFVVSSAALHMEENSKQTVRYLKPVQTGYPVDSDSRFVSAVVDAMLPSQKIFQSSDTLFTWKDAVSPHLAANANAPAVEDKIILQEIKKYLEDAGSSLVILETAGGPGSPGPSGTLQCDMLRSLRHPVLLVGDGKLGGISTTLSSYEMMKLRGYSIPILAILENNGKALENYKIIEQNVDPETRVFPLSSIECHSSDIKMRQKQLLEWLKTNRTFFREMRTHSKEFHKGRMDFLQHTAASDSLKCIWWPFTQHNSMKEDEITVIDSRYGEEIVVADRQRRSSLRPVYDGCASWWTQGIDAKHVPGMALHVAEAVGRYGHVIFPRNIHQPALELAKIALDTVGTGWASRVFFSDNGSTAVEVALKMAFRKYMKDHNILERDEIGVDVLGVQGAYHGDTLGTMDAVAPSVFNGRLQTPWFKGRGRFLDPPTVQMKNGRIFVDIPEGIEYGREAILSDDWDLVNIFSKAKRDPGMRKAYKQYIEDAINDHPTRIGACIIEPIVQGAGGMRMVDPEFHRAMSIVCKEKRIPLVVDEVFTGMWRLGAPSAAVHLLNIEPDIGCYAKLLTGGVVPMSLTLASEEVFNAFQGDSKAEALLHGHSYTAHPIGCAAGVYFFNSMKDVNPEDIVNLWDESKLKFLSNMPEVKGLFALGTVISVQLAAANQSGYESNAAEELAAKLNKKSIYARPLGDVLYIMVTPFTSRSTCDDLLQKLVDCLLLK